MTYPQYLVVTVQIKVPRLYRRKETPTTSPIRAIPVSSLDQRDFPYAIRVSLVAKRAVRAFSLTSLLSLSRPS